MGCWGGCPLAIMVSLGSLALLLFFAFGGIRNDEMFKINIAKAGLNAFVVSFVSITFAIAALSILQTLETAALFVGVIFFCSNMYICNFVLCL